mmetsp:Transcript_3919/g.6648  ORF Transcript_3919/g.6648 Transcript_3919/m.6648 type:complete len:130 (+) Transcript_3919:414-803(+)
MNSMKVAEGLMQGVLNELKHQLFASFISILDVVNLQWVCKPTDIQTFLLVMEIWGIQMPSDAEKLAHRMGQSTFMLYQSLFRSATQPQHSRSPSRRQNSVDPSYTERLEIEDQARITALLRTNDQQQQS